jgi:hypothetical protein
MQTERQMRSILLSAASMACGLFLLVASCSATSAAEAPAAPSPTVEHGELDHLSEYVGKFPSDVDLWNKAFLRDRLQALLKSDRDAMTERMQTVSPVSKEGGIYYVIGNKAHAGGEDAAIFVADPSQNVIRIWLLKKGKIEELGDPVKAMKLPSEVRTTLSDWQEQ